MMQIAFCASEAAPFAKVGGLGDVVGSLPKALADLGYDMSVVIPLYGAISREEYILTDAGERFSVTASWGKDYPIHVMSSTLPGSNVPIYFLGNYELFEAVGEIYPADNPGLETARYEVFARACLAWFRQMNWQPDVLHVHDWHTSVLASLLGSEAVRHDPFYQGTGSVLSLHNMAYQGEYGGVNRLREGLLSADALIAVSPTYAREIQSSEGGAGLEQVIKSQSRKLTGILNGIDMDLFNPATDRFISRQYTAETADTGKTDCKRALQLEIGLPQDENVPVFGLVSRFVEQKGLVLLLEIAEGLKDLPAQFVLLGTGQPEYEAALREWNTRSTNIRTMIGFNLALAQLVYAGSDAFLMPSRFEPCGLGQMIAMRYGSLPVARKVGGLADTVFDPEERPEEATGFVFAPYTGAALYETIKRAIACRAEQPDTWRAMRQRGMTRDFSWRQSAIAYEAVYQSVSQQRKTLEHV